MLVQLLPEAEPTLQSAQELQGLGPEENAELSDGFLPADTTSFDVE